MKPIPDSEPCDAEEKAQKKFIKMRLPDGPLLGSKEAFEKGYFIAQPGAIIEVLVEDLTEGLMTEKDREFL